MLANAYLDEETPLFDAVIQRTKAEGIKLTMCDGEVIYRDGAFTEVDRDAALKALHEQLKTALSDEEAQASQACQGAATARAGLLCERRGSGEARTVL